MFFGGINADRSKKTAGGLFSVLCYFVPSRAAFEGIMNLADSDQPMIYKDMFILAAHCIIWFLLYLSISKWQRKHS